MASTLQVVNLGLLIVGGLCLAGVLAWLARRGRWRNPLAGTVLPLSGPGILGVVAVMLAFVAVQMTALSVVDLVWPAETEAAPGSARWHVLHCADAAGSILISILMIALLVAARPAGARPTRMKPLSAAAAAVLALLAVLPIVALQSEMGRIIWTWVYPDAAPPTHVVLQALSESAWGRWGAVQLVVGAVLIAPIEEELFFRGVLLQAVCHHLRSGWLAILLSAAAFGLAHVSQPQDVLPLVSLGVVLGYLRLRCGSLWPCILPHMLFNARTMIYVILAPELLMAG